MLKEKENIHKGQKSKEKKLDSKVYSTNKLVDTNPNTKKANSKERQFLRDKNCNSRLSSNNPTGNESSTCTFAKTRLSTSPFTKNQKLEKEMDNSQIKIIEGIAPTHIPKNPSVIALSKDNDITQSGAKYTDSKKRSFTVIASSYDIDSSSPSFQKLNELLSTYYDLFEKGSREWIDPFMQEIVAKEFTCDQVTSFPRSLSELSSSILIQQKFWILWIESFLIQGEISIDKIINLFNESFNYINEENLIKGYYLITMKSQNMDEMKQYFARKFPNDMRTTFTNRDYCQLLESYAQFLLSGANTAPSGDKKRKSQSHSVQEVKKDNVISSQSELELICRHTHKFNEIIQTVADNMSFLPMKSSLIGVGERQNQESEKKDHVESELKDEVESLMGNSQKTEKMIVSQNTISLQNEFVTNLQREFEIHTNENICHGCIPINSSQCPNFEELTNISIHANLSQETDYQNTCSLSNVKVNVDKICENIDTEKTCEKNKMVTVNDCEENQTTNLDAQADAASFEDQDPELLPGEKEEISKQKLDEEKLDKFEDILPDNGNFSVNNGTCTKKSHLSASGRISSSKSRSTRGRKYDGVEDVFPDNLVEGSIIRTLNQSFSKGENSSLNKSFSE